MATLGPIRRRVARVLLFDGSDRLLLFYVEAGPASEGAAWWYLPGGGIGDGESAEDAVRRELREEAGIVGVELGPLVLVLRGVRFRYAGRDFEQDEWLFLGRVADGRIGRGRAGDLEASAVAAHRWWPLDELARSGDVFYPRNLASLVEVLLRVGPPSEPWVADGEEGFRG